MTAQKRGSQNLQDVPVSISVIGGNRLDESAFQGVNDAIASMPGITQYDTAQSGGSRITLRGVAPAAAIFSSSSTSAYYLDQMPFSFSRLSITPDASPYDLDRVELLKGPQGTLYGAAALGGVVRILTRNPNLNEFEIKGRAEISETEEGGTNYRGDVALNAPIVPGKLAVRIVAGVQENGGWIDTPVEDDLNDADIKTARVKVGAEPTDRLRIDFSAWYSRDDRDMMDSSLEDRTTPNDVEQPIQTDYDLYGLGIEYDFGNDISLISSSTYMDYFNIGTMQIVPGLPLDFELGPGVPNYLRTELHNELFAQEVRLHSTNAGPWNWSIGGFYRDTDEFRESTGVLGDSSDRLTSQQVAVFGEVTRAFLDGALELTAGLRYFNDDVTLQELTRNEPLEPGEQLQTVDDSFDEVTSRLVLSWYANPDMTLYASFGEGFRSGVLQGTNALEVRPDLPNAEPDVLTNYEIGAKGTTAGGRLRYDFALYYLDWEDVQQSLRFLPTSGGQNVPFTATANAGDASGPGVDLGLDFAVTDSLTLHGSLGWNDLTFDQDIVSPTGEVLFAGGSRLDQSAEWTGNARMNYAFPFGDSGYRGRLSASWSYSDSLDIRNPAGQFAYADSIIKSDASFTLTPPSQNLSFTFFVNNLTDEDGIVAILDEVFPNFDTRLRPRTWGVRMSVVY
ncbi:TonB-dependent receptor [Elongatibacter sediminis]|uniref:TonB-dependent receptor n=1 Tax=Elongatibacter sediminis TaxID=3119006 RepID=UPI00339D73B1